MDKLKGMARVRQENKARVRQYFTDSPFNNQKECAEALGLTRVTVGSLIKEIKQDLAKRDKG